MLFSSLMMVSNTTYLVCDVVPIWSGYVWGAQGGVTWDVCSIFLLIVPPFLALYFSILNLSASLQLENNVLDRFDTKVHSFNSRVENMILNLRRTGKDTVSFFNQVPIPRISFDESSSPNHSEGFTEYF